MLFDWITERIRRLRRPRQQLDVSELAKIGRAMPAVDVSPFGPPLAWLGDGSLQRAPIDTERDWNEMIPELAWSILNERRAVELFQRCKSEHEIYTSLLRRSGPRYQGQVFIGIRPGARPEPILVPRYLFSRHGYILGGTGVGKTSYAVAQLMIQLGDYFIDDFGRREDNPPILIFDMKYNGDKFLRAIAEQMAATRGQTLRFFSNNSAFRSLQFDPLHCFRSVKEPLRLAETLMRALSIVFPEGYGPTFFANEQRITFLKILSEGRPDSFDRKIELVRKATYGKHGNTDARGLYASLAALKLAENCHTDNSPIADDERIDFNRLFDNREILYIHLDTRGLPMASKDVGRLLLYALVETAAQREQQGKKVQSFVILDEFQRIAAKNVVDMAEDARQSGLGFIFAHQSLKSLLTNDHEDLFAILFDNCGFFQALSLKDERLIEKLRLISSREVELRWSGSSSKTTSSFASFGGSHSTGVNSNGSSTSSSGTSASFGSGVAHSESLGWKEEMVPGLKPEMITDVHSHAIRSVIQVNAPDDDMVTPLGGKPTVVQGLYPFSVEEAMAMAKKQWPRNPERDDAYYYRKTRPQVTRISMTLASDKMAIPDSNGQGSLFPPALPAPSAPSEPAATAASSGGQCNAVRAPDPDYVAKLNQLCEALKPHMLKTMRT